MTLISDGLNELRLLEKNPLPISKTYMSKAYKKDAPDGVVSYRLIKHFVNDFQIPDRKILYLISRRYLWSQWCQHCGIRETASIRTGFTLNYEIYNDLINDTEMSELVMHYEKKYYRFRQKDILHFVTDYKTIVKNQNHGFMEVGLPVNLAYNIK